MQLKLFALLTIIFIFLNSCTHPLLGPVVVIEHGLKIKETPSSPKEQLKALDSVLNQKKLNKFRHEMADIRNMLIAQDLEEQNKILEARKYWLAAIEQSSSSYTRTAFRGWVDNIIKDPRMPKNLIIISEHILDLSNQGRNNKYMSNKGLNNIKKVSKSILKWHPELKVKKKSSSAIVKVPKNSSIKKNDPLFIKTSKKYCDTPKALKKAWSKFIGSLNNLQLNYWRGMVRMCEKKELEAAKYFLKSAKKAEKSIRYKNHPIAISSYSNLVRIYRKNDRRADAAKFYIKLIKAWKLPGLTPKKFKQTKQQLVSQKVNDHLWAARYQALIGQYKLAKDYTNKALKIISKSVSKYSRSFKYSDSHLNEMYVYKAEAYFLLLTRIAVETKDFTFGLKLIENALSMNHLSPYWKERFVWHQGLLHFIMGNYNQSIRVWTDQLNEFENEKNKPRLFFWLAYANFLKKDKSEADYYLNLLEESTPFNYYSLVAPNVAGINDHIYLESYFSNPMNLKEKLYQENKYQRELFKESNSLSIDITKAEILYYAGLKDWAKIANGNLLYLALSTIDITSDKEEFIYLTRYFYAVHDYQRAITLTRKILSHHDDLWDENPEQIHILYPDGFSSLFEKERLRYSVNKNLLTSLTRQESEFNPKAQSFANAYGLMQLIQPTAKRVAKFGKFSYEKTKDKLLDPSTNIRYGSAYNKILQDRYKNYKPAMIAAYNAGEFAVDAWLKRRQYKNPLIWIELIPFGETRKYVQHVLRNFIVYKHLNS